MARILIVDDEPAIRSMMAVVLTEMGHAVVQASAVREGLELHTAEPADLIITDLVMKEMDGTELIRRVMIFSPRTPVIAVSGNRSSTIYLNMAKLLGAARVLAKPFSPRDLFEVVQHVLDDAMPTSGATS